MLARVRSSPSPELAGRRPTATSTRSNVSVSLPSKRASIAAPFSRSEATFVPRRIFAKSFSHRRASGWTSARSTPGRSPSVISTSVTLLPSAA